MIFRYNSDEILSRDEAAPYPSPVSPAAESMMTDVPDPGLPEARIGNTPFSCLCRHDDTFRLNEGNHAWGEMPAFACEKQKLALSAFTAVFCRSPPNS